VGLRLRRRHPVRWAADFRDPWLDLLMRREGHPRTAATDLVLRWFERTILRRADHVVAVAAGTHAALAAKVEPAARDKVVLVRNGVEEVRPARQARAGGPFRIIYTGAFYDDRDPRLFLTALAQVRAARGLGPDTLRVDFIGVCRRMATSSMGWISVEQFVRDLGLDDVVHFHDWMAQPDVLAALAASDLLLLLARGMELQFPNKLYDYLGMRLPIFAWADPGGEAAETLRALPGHFVYTGDELEGMMRTIESALATTPVAATSEAQERLLEEWSVPRQMGRLVEQLTAS
jgi:glycosyltransferase involved in cell wall biosynthesis